MKRMLAYVVDNDGIVIYDGIDFVDYLSSTYNGKITHVLLKYYVGLANMMNSENPVSIVIPIDRVYFRTVECENE